MKKLLASMFDWRRSVPVPAEVRLVQVQVDDVVRADIHLTAGGAPGGAHPSRSTAVERAEAVLPVGAQVPVGLVERAPGAVAKRVWPNHWYGASTLSDRSDGLIADVERSGSSRVTPLVATCQVR
jgi:hypothetical protein